MTQSRSPGAHVELYVDLAIRVEAGDIIVVGKRCYGVISVRVQKHGKHASRQRLWCAVIAVRERDAYTVIQLSGGRLTRSICWLDSSETATAAKHTSP